MQKMFSSFNKVIYTFSKLSIEIPKQMHACNIFYGDQMPTFKRDLLIEKEKLEFMKNFQVTNSTAPVYNMTGLDAHNIVSGLCNIVNNPDQFEKGKEIYLYIQLGDPKTDYEEVVFRLNPNPTKDQPGNAIVFMVPREEKVKAKSYKQLNRALKEHYKTDTKSFAEDIKKLLKNNKDDGPPQVTREVYVIWVFEIARRLVKSEISTDKKKQFDSLPIGSAIAGIVQLLELGDPKRCSFDDVFEPGRKFHCFSGEAETREKAIHDINEANSKEELTETDYLKLLQKCFCAEGELEEVTPEKKLAEDVKALTLRSGGDNALVLYVPPDLKEFY